MTVAHCTALAVLHLTFVATVSAAPKPFVDPAVAQLLELTRVFERSRDLSAQLIGELQRAYPAVPPELWANYAQRIGERQSVLNLYGPIYRRYLTPRDTALLVREFQSPLGQRFLRGLDDIERSTQKDFPRWTLAMATGLLAAESHLPPAGGDAAYSRTGDVVAIEELICLSGQLASARTISQQMLERLADAKAAPELLSRAKAELADGHSLARFWIPEYARVFTPEDIRARTIFYRTGLGKRWAHALPLIRVASLRRAAQSNDWVAHQAVRDVLGPLPQWRLLHPNRRLAVPDPIASQEEGGGTSRETQRLSSQ